MYAIKAIAGCSTARRPGDAGGTAIPTWSRASGYPALFAEVGKLRVPVLDGRPLVLATAEPRCRNRYKNFVGVVGIESVPAVSTDREDRSVTDGDRGSAPDAGGPSRTQAVARLATALADAVLAGDHEQARVLAEELRALQAGSAAPSLRKVW